MSCNTTPCDDKCLPYNPCYDDCGCLNPTTFECVTKPGTWSALGITNDMNGVEALEALNTVINNLTITPPSPGSDVYVKATSADTTANYLSSKLIVGAFLTKTIVNPSGNEQIRLNVSPAALVSSDSGNILDIGTDGKLRAIVTVPLPDISVVGGSGVTVTGTGPSSDPFVVSINPSIEVVRNCFDNVWRDVTLVATGNANVVYVSGIPKYRYRFDGTIEFKGSATYTVAFGAYSTGNRKYTITIGNIPTTCVTSGEQAGVSDLKNINYIDVPQAGADQITQQYGYIIRKSTANLIVEFQSSFTSSTSKTIVVNFEGAISYPSL